MSRYRSRRILAGALSLGLLCVASPSRPSPLTLTRVIDTGGSSINYSSEFGSSDYLLFWGYDGSSGTNGAIGQPWRSDGTASGTQLIKAISGSAAASFPDGSAFAARIAGVDLFAYDNGLIHSQVWRSDGTANGTYPLSSFAATDAPGWFVSFGNRLFFLSSAGCTLNNQCLWSTDGSATAAIAMPNIAVPIGSVVAVQQKLVFPGYLASVGAGLFASGGTENDTDMLVDSSGNPQNVVAVNDKAFFTNSDPVHGDELWVSDLTPDGTHMVADINPGTGDSSSGGGVRVGDLLFFVPLVPTSGRELWRSDGTPGGTFEVKEIRPGLFDANISSLVSFKPLGAAAKAFFFADDGVHGLEPWISDGTAAGTFALGDLNPGAAPSLPGQFAWLSTGGSFLYFGADNGSGTHLWRTDGTVAGTKIVDADMTIGDAEPVGTAAGRLFAAAFDGSGAQLYQMNLLDYESLAPHGSQWCARPELVIPDTETVSSTVQLPAHGGLTHLDFVTLDIAHTFVGDLTVTLTHEETGTSVILLDQPLGPDATSCSSDLIDISLADGAATPANSACSDLRNAYTPAGKYKPVEALSAFAGKPVAGHWSLTITDQARNDSGTLHQWCMGFQHDYVFAGGFQ